MTQSLSLPLAEPALPFLPQHDEPLGLLEREVAERDHRGRVVLRLQQPGDELRLVHPDRPRRLLHPDVGLEPVGQDVVVAVPPAGPVRLLGQREELLALAGVDPVQREQVEHVDLADRVPAELDPADLGLRRADLAGRLTRGDASGLAEPPQVGAEQDAQHGRPVRRFRHAADLLVNSRRRAARRSPRLGLRGRYPWVVRAIALPGPRSRSRANHIACHSMSAIRPSPDKPLPAAPRPPGDPPERGPRCADARELCMHKPRGPGVRGHAGQAWQPP